MIELLLLRGKYGLEMGQRLGGKALQEITWKWDLTFLGQRSQGSVKSKTINSVEIAPLGTVKEAGLQIRKKKKKRVGRCDPDHCHNRTPLLKP